MPKNNRAAPLLNSAIAPAYGIAETVLLKTGVLQNAILNSASLSLIATDTGGVIQIFNIGAERMLGYTAADVLGKLILSDFFDREEVIARARTLSAASPTPIPPGFEALVFKAAQGIEDVFELTHARKDGSRFAAVVSVAALRDAQPCRAMRPSAGPIWRCTRPKQLAAIRFVSTKHKLRACASMRYVCKRTVWSAPDTYDSPQMRIRKQCCARPPGATCGLRFTPWQFG